MNSSEKGGNMSKSPDMNPSSPSSHVKENVITEPRGRAESNPHSRGKRLLKVSEHRSKVTGQESEKEEAT